MTTLRKIIAAIALTAAVTAPALPTMAEPAPAPTEAPTPAGAVAEAKAEALAHPESHQSFYWHVEVYGAGIPAWQGFAYKMCIDRYWKQIRYWISLGFIGYSTINKCVSFGGYYIIDVRYWDKRW